MKRYEIKHERGGKMDGWYIWDNTEKRVVAGKLSKLGALTLMKIVYDPKPVLPPAPEKKKRGRPKKVVTNEPVQAQV